MKIHASIWAAALLSISCGSDRTPPSTTPSPQQVPRNHPPPTELRAQIDLMSSLLPDSLGELRRRASTVKTETGERQLAQVQSTYQDNGGRWVMTRLTFCGKDPDMAACRKRWWKETPEIPIADGDGKTGADSWTALSGTPLPTVQRRHSEDWMETEVSPYLFQMRAHGLDADALKQTIGLLPLSKLQQPLR